MTVETLNKQLLKAAEQGNIDGMKEALEQGADVNARNYLDMTPMLCSAWCGYLTTDLINLLVSYGADINSWDKWNRTVIMVAAENSYITTELIEVLVSHGADVNARNRKGHTLLEACLFEWSFTRNIARNIASLLSCGAALGCTPEDFITRLEQNDNTNAWERSACVLLMVSSMYPERNETLEGYVLKNRSRAVNLILPCMTDASPSIRNGFLGILSEGRSSPLSLSPRNIPAMVNILLETLDTNPGLAAEFIRKRVGKKIESWVNDGVEGADILISRLVPYIKREKEVTYLNYP